MLPLPVATSEQNSEPLYTSELQLKIDQMLKKKLLYEWNTYVAHYYHNGAWWCRCSAQVWNEVGITAPFSILTSVSDIAVYL